jgi:hypothetical protein
LTRRARFPLASLQRKEPIRFFSLQRTRVGAAVAAVVAAVALLAACNRQLPLPPGTYSGSTANDVELTIEIGDKVKVNKVRARIDRHGDIVVRRRQTRLDCAPRAKGDELHCLVIAPDHRETVDLLRL